MARKSTHTRKDKTDGTQLTSNVPRLVTVVFRITGDKPLLQHNCEGQLTRDATSTGPRVIPSAKDEAEKASYRLPNRQLYIKPEAFQGSLIGTRGGAAGRKIGKFTANTRIAAGVDFLVEDQCALIHPTTDKPIQTYEIDERPVVIKGSGRVLRARPRIEFWACCLTVEIDERYITIPMLLELLNVSGKVAGVGDFRPQCKGRFGKYHAEVVAGSIQVIETFGEVAEEELDLEDAA